MRGATYARLSDVRKGDTDGIERQVRENEAHAARLGVEIVERLVDDDISAGTKKRRPAFDRLMAGIAGNEWDVVILRSLDRWVRRPAELEQIIEVVEKSKVRVEAIHGEIDLRTRQGRLTARLMTAVAMSEVEASRERVIDWHADRAARGLPSSGAMGFGYRKSGEKVEIVPEEAAAIRDAARRVVEGEPLARIGASMGMRGISLRRILMAPRTAGLRTHNGQTTDGSWEPILDRFTWERVRSILNHPERRTQSSTSAHLLTGLATCWRCQNTLNSWRDKATKTRRYRCRHCMGVTVFAERLEEHVETLLFARVDRPPLASVEPEVGEDEIAAQILTLEADIEAVAQDAAEGSITLAEFKILRAGMAERLDALRRQIQRPVVNEWQGRGAELAAGWSTLTVSEQRAILRNWIVEIRIGPAVVGANRFDPRRVEVSWRD